MKHPWLKCAKPPPYVPFCVSGRSEEDIYDAIGGSLVPSSEDEDLLDPEGNIDINAAGADAATNAADGLPLPRRRERSGGGQQGKALGTWHNRLAWVDALKVFLTFALVTYQIACVYGPRYTITFIVHHGGVIRLCRRAQAHKSQETHLPLIRHV